MSEKSEIQISEFPESLLISEYNMQKHKLIISNGVHRSGGYIKAVLLNFELVMVGHVDAHRPQRGKWRHFLHQRVSSSAALIMFIKG